MLHGKVRERRTLKLRNTNLAQNRPLITSPDTYNNCFSCLPPCVSFCCTLRQLRNKLVWISNLSGISQSWHTRRAPRYVILSWLVSSGSCLQISHGTWDVSTASPIETSKMGRAQADENRCSNKTQILLLRIHTPKTISCHCRLHFEQELCMSHSSTQIELLSSNSLKTHTIALPLHSLCAHECKNTGYRHL